MYNLTNTILAQAEPVEIVGIALLVIVLLVAFVFLLLFLKFFRSSEKGRYKDNSSEQNNRGSGRSDTNKGSGALSESP